MSIFNELKRRNVLRVGIAYAVLAWLVMQVADVILNNIEAPDWIFQVIMLLLGIGFLFAMFFSWAFELTPEGLKRESEVDRSQSITSKTGKKLDRLTMGVLVLALGYFAVDKFVLSSDRESAAIEAALEKAGAQIETSDTAVPSTKSEEIVTDRSIAVLPFVNMSSDEEQEYFSDGLSEELLNLLAKIPELRVAARTSSFSLKGKEMQMSEIGQLLNVAHVLEGSVRKSGDRLRITAQLIKTDDGFHMWSETFDRTLDDVFAIQDEIAEKVVKALKLALLGTAPTVAETNPEAYSMILQARHLRHQQSKDSLDQAEQLYKAALELAPDYAEGWAGLAKVYAGQTTTGMINRVEGLKLITGTANRAISLDSQNASAWAVLGTNAVFSNNPKAAANSLQKALQLDPNNLEVLNSAAVLLELLGRQEEAVELLKRVVSRDPVNADGHSGLGRSYRVMGQWDNAIESYQTSLSLTPGRYGSYQGMAESYLFKNELEKALETYQLEPDIEWKTKGTALVYYKQGKMEEFEKTFTELRENWGDEWPSEIAHVYAWIGDNDAAFEWLDKAVIDNEEGLYQQYFQPLLNSLHDDPRWEQFREKTVGSSAEMAAIPFVVNLPD